jgi:hypothetical protein
MLMPGVSSFNMAQLLLPAPSIEHIAHLCTHAVCQSVANPTCSDTSGPVMPKLQIVFNKHECNTVMIDEFPRS